MATVYVSMGPVGSFSESAGVAVFQGNRTASETITSSAATAKGALESNGFGMAKVFCDTAVYAASGPQASVNATATNGQYVPAGLPTYIGIQDGYSVAVIDV